MKSVKGVLRRVGMDRTICYALMAQGWTLFSGPVTLWFLAAHLTPVEQGFYYTFGSVLGLQVFFELGTSFVLLQFTSHEKAHLEWTSERTLTGDPRAKARLASLLRRAMAWYGVLALLLVLVMIPAGWLFFEKSVANTPAALKVGAQSIKNVFWQGPWVWLVCVTAGTLLMSPINAVVQGCGILAEFALLRFCQNVVTSLVSWVLLTLGWHLLAAPAFNMAALLLSVVWVWKRYGAMLRDLWEFRVEGIEMNWMRDVWPLQWKIGLSGISAFFAFSLFNPILFALGRPIAAGQMGMTNAVLAAVAQGGGSWINTKLQPFGVLVARKKWRELDRLFFPALWQSLVLVTVASLCVAGAIWALQLSGHRWGVRFLPPLPLLLFIAATLANHVAGAQALYLRAHKKDPLIVVSVVTGAMTALCCYFGGRFFGLTGMMWGYFAVSLLFSLAAGTWVFQQKRQEWHTEEDDEQRDLVEITSDEIALLPFEVQAANSRIQAPLGEKRSEVH